MGLPSGAVCTLACCGLGEDWPLVLRGGVDGMVASAGAGSGEEAADDKDGASPMSSRVAIIVFT